jgi:hypothetical protein
MYNQYPAAPWETPDEEEARRIALEQEIARLQQMSAQPQQQMAPAGPPPGIAPAQPGILDPQARAVHPMVGGAFADVQRAADQRRAVGLAAAEDLPEDGLGKNFLKIGLPAIIAGLGTMGLAALPMAVAFGLGSASEETKQQRNRRRDAFKDVADEDYALAKDELEMTQEILGVGGKNQTPARVRAFEMLTAGLSPEEKERARRMELGLEGKAQRFGYKMAVVEGSDGSKRPVLTSPTGQVWSLNGAGGWDNYSLMPGERVMIQNEETGELEDADPLAGLPPDAAQIAAQMQSQAQGAPQAPQQGGSSAQGQIAAPGPSPAQNPAIPGPSRPSFGGGGAVNPLVSQNPAERAYQTEAAQRQAQQDVPVAPAGWRVNQDGSLSPLPGSEYEREHLANRQTARDNIRRIAPKMMRDVTRAIELAEHAGPIAGVIASPGEEGSPTMSRRLLATASPAYVLNQHLESIKSNISIEELQKMREASPTGGALGQIPVQQQRYLMQLRGALNPEIPADVLRENLAGVYNDYVLAMANAMYGDDMELNAAVQDGRQTPEWAENQRLSRESIKEEMLRATGWNEWGRRDGELDIDTSDLSPAARAILERSRSQ